MDGTPHAIVADVVGPLGGHMLQQAANERQRWQGNHLAGYRAAVSFNYLLDGTVSVYPPANRMVDVDIPPHDGC
jgi:hypothetical protein